MRHRLPGMFVVIAALVASVVPIVAVAPASVAAGKVPTMTALWGPPAASYGSTVRINGYLRKDGSGDAMPGETVLIQRSPRNQGRWGTISSRTMAGSQVNFTVDVVQTTAYDYRAHYPGSAQYAPHTSRILYPAVLRKVIFDSIRTTSHQAGALQAAGRLYPAPADGSPVYLQRYVSTTRTWKSIAAGRSRGNAVTIDALVGGSTLTYRLYAPASFPFGAGVSGAASHQHFVWRGAFVKPLLAKGGTANPEFTVIPAGEAPERSEAELLADRTGTVWGDLNTSGCVSVRSWLGNITDGTIRASLRRGSTVLGAVDMRQETEAVLIRSTGGAARTRLQVQDLASGHGPIVAVDTWALCNN